jgi:hypothetical protein
MMPDSIESNHICCMWLEQPASKLDEDHLVDCLLASSCCFSFSALNISEVYLNPLFSYALVKLSN